ncbi:unnamed protein product [Discosporangium mesarthrocarpum]
MRSSRLFTFLLGPVINPKSPVVHLQPRHRPFCGGRGSLFSGQTAGWTKVEETRRSVPDKARRDEVGEGCLPPPGNGGDEVDDNGLSAVFSMHVRSSEEMERVGNMLGEDCQEGDVVLLSGDLGTGKTCFARGFIRAMVGDSSLPVTSPSYLLDNTYQAEGGEVIIHHMDLYRLSGESDLHILKIPEVLQTSVCLIEWPCRLGKFVPDHRLDVSFLALSEDKRNITFHGYGEWWAGAVMELRDKVGSNTV